MRKPVNVIYQFDDVEYTEAERDLLWGKLFLELANLQLKLDEQEKEQEKKEDVPQCKIY